MKKSILFLVATTVSTTQAMRISQKSTMPYDPRISSAVGLDDIMPSYPIPAPDPNENLVQGNEKSREEVKEKVKAKENTSAKSRSTQSSQEDELDDIEAVQLNESVAMDA